MWSVGPFHVFVTVIWSWRSQAGICSRPELGSRGPRRIRAVEQTEQWDRGAAAHNSCVGFDGPSGISAMVHWS